MKLPVSRIVPVIAGAVSSILLAMVAMSITHKVVVYYSIFKDFSTVIDLKSVRVSCIVFSILAAYPVIWEFFIQLSAQKLLPEKLAKRILRSIEEPGPENVPIPRTILLGVAFALTGLGILLLIVLMGNTAFLPSDDFSLSLYETVSFVRKSEVHKTGFPHVVNAYFSVPQEEAGRYAEDCLELAKTFSDAGAKGVLLPLSDAAGMSNDIDIWRAVDSTGVAVIGMRSPMMLNWERGPGVTRRGTYKYDQLWTYTAYKTIQLVDPDDLSLQNPPSDVLLALLKLYQGLPPTAKIHFDGSAIRIGDIEIPCQADGTMYSRSLWHTSKPVELAIKRVGSFTVAPMYLGDEKTEAAAYGPHAKGELRFGSLVERPGAEPVALDNNELRARVSGKIVMMMTNLAPRFSNLGYGNALENILAGSVTRKVPNGFVWYSLLALLVAAGLTLLVRPLLASLLILFSGIVFTYAGSILLDSTYIYLDIFYPLLAVAVSSFTSPVLRFVIFSAGIGKQNG